MDINIIYDCIATSLQCNRRQKNNSTIIITENKKEFISLSSLLKLYTKMDINIIYDCIATSLQSNRRRKQNVAISITNCKFFIPLFHKL